MTRGIIRLAALTCLSAAGVLGAGPAMAGTAISLNPKGTFLRTQGDAALAPLVVDLGALGLGAGQYVQLFALGAYDNGPSGDTTNSTVAVFSTTSALGASSVLNRVAGALEAGDDYVTAATFNGGLATDIPQDFLVPKTGVVLQIPVGAKWLFVGPADSLYRDNTDPNGDYAFTIGLAPVPEPGTWALMMSGLAGIGAVARRRRATRH